MAGISEEWEDRAKRGGWCICDCCCYQELTQEVRHLGERLDRLIALLNQEMIEPGAADTA